MKLLRAAAFALAATVITATATLPQGSTAVVSAVDIADSALVKTLPGFEEGTVTEHGSVDEAGIIRCQQDCRPGDLVGVSPTRPTDT